MSRPTMQTNVSAARYAAPNERIAEFSGGQPDASTGMRPGGLISLRALEDGTLHLHVYRQDPAVAVTVEGHRVLRQDGVTVLDAFTPDEIECLVLTAGELFARYGDPDDILSGRQAELAGRAQAEAGDWVTEATAEPVDFFNASGG